MKTFDWKDFKKCKCGVHCKTMKEAQRFIELASKQGIKWAYSRADETNWNIYKENTYYTHEDNLMYGNVCENDCGLPVFDFSDIDSPIDLIKDGMVVETADLQRYLVITKDNQRILTNINVWLKLDNYDKNLQFHNPTTYLPVPHWNINTIYKMSGSTLSDLFNENNNDCEIVWEREEIEFMTLEQVCKELGKKIKIKED